MPANPERQARSKFRDIKHKANETFANGKKKILKVVTKYSISFKETLSAVIALQDLMLLPTRGGGTRAVVVPLAAFIFTFTPAQQAASAPTPLFGTSEYLLFWPDFASTSVERSYDAETDRLTIRDTSNNSKLVFPPVPGPSTPQTRLDVEGLNASLTATIRFDEDTLETVFDSGEFLIRGGIPALGIPGGSNLLLGTVTSIDHQCPGQCSNPPNLFASIPIFNLEVSPDSLIPTMDAIWMTSMIVQRPGVTQENLFSKDFIYTSDKFTDIRFTIPTSSPLSLIAIVVIGLGFTRCGWKRGERELVG